MKTEPKVYYHRLVSRDVRAARNYYRKASPELALAFRKELKEAINFAARHPTRFHFVEEFRRLNLRRFPYHVLFQTVEDGIRVMVVRHNKRDPGFGSSRV